MTSPKLIIICITYNHANFIRHALDGFVMQKTNFPFQAYIADDHSTDGTSDIIREYAEKYPDIIKPLIREKNIGPFENFIDVASRVKSEYVAMCEGDDFWIDENKLQKQVDFLEANSEFSICFHPVEVFFEKNDGLKSIWPTAKYRFDRDVLDLNDLLQRNFIQTNSVVYRWRFNNENIRDVFSENMLPCDWFMHLLHAQRGKIEFMDDMMSLYRRHPDGMWFDSHACIERLHLKHGIAEMNFFAAVEHSIAPDSVKYRNEHVIPFAAELKHLYIKNKEYGKAAEIIGLYPEVLGVAYPLGNIEYKVKLFGYISILKLKRFDDKLKIYLFGIPVARIRTKNIAENRQCF